MNSRVLIVVKDEKQKRDMRDKFPPRHWQDRVIVTPGCGLAGSRFEYIFLVGWEPGDGDSELLQQRGKQWYEESVLCRLPPNGVVISTPELNVVFP